MTNPEHTWEHTWDETGPGLAQTDYSTCLHLIKWRCGFTSLRQQLWRCAFCKHGFISDRRRLEPVDEIRLTARLYRQGRTMEYVIEASGLSHLTVYGLFMGYRRRWPEYSVGRIYPPECVGKPNRMALRNKVFKGHPSKPPHSIPGKSDRPSQNRSVLVPAGA